MSQKCNGIYIPIDVVHCGDFLVVGAAGLEPAASCSQSRRSSQLSYAPILVYGNPLSGVLCLT